MIRQSILAVLLMSYTVCGVILGEDSMEEKIEETKRYYATAEEYCSMEDLGEMDYYLFCDTQLNKGASGYEGKPSIINNDTQTVEEGKELYQKFREQLPLEEEEENRGNDSDEDEKTEVIYISPDCKWAVTHKWSEHQTITTQTLFYEKEKIREEVSESSPGERQIWIVRDEDGYRVMEEEQYKKLLKIVNLSGFDERYFGLRSINAEGTLAVERNNDYSQLVIRRAKDGTELWSFDLQGIHKEARKIREARGYEEDSLWVAIEQFEGNEEEGWLVVQIGPSSFFRISYPSGEVTYLGEYLYSPCFSPDGKYLAYSSVDYDNGVGMEPEEEKQTPPPGIYVREVETGKTAYIYWEPSIDAVDNYLDYRSFTWLEKEGFEEYIGDTGTNK